MASFDITSNPNYQKYWDEINGRVVDVYIASLPRQLHVVETVKSVLANPQTLTITIVANNYSDELFEELKIQLLNINTITQVPIMLHRGNNAKESNEKLKYIAEGYGKYISFTDDDLLLAPNHYQKLIEGCEKYNAYVSLHGVCLHQLPIRSYYRDRDVYRGLGTVLFDMEVDLASNCGSLFKRSFFTKEELESLYPNAPVHGMDDILMATLCRQKGIKRYVLSHVQGFMKHKEIRKEDNYVFDKYALVQGADKPMTDYINKYWK